MSELITHKLLPIDRLVPALIDATGDDRWRDVRAELISGGKSNLTFLLSSSAGEFILRRPPTGNLLPTAHDMVREAQVQSALADTPVPTAPIVLVDEGDLIGISCYVMERVPGVVPRDSLPAGYATTADERRALSFAFVDSLAALHTVNIASVGLADYGKPTDYAQRLVRRWTGQWEKSRTHDVPEIDELARRLASQIPEQVASTIVHGDYRIDNCVFDTHNPGRINAVLDWELSTLGDPLTDLGYLLMFWRHSGESQVSSLAPTVTNQGGFPTRDEIIDRYARASDLPLDSLAFHIALAHFKFAIIAQGVAARSRAGAMGGQDFGDLDDEILATATIGLSLT